LFILILNLKDKNDVFSCGKNDYFQTGNFENKNFKLIFKWDKNLQIDEIYPGNNIVFFKTMGLILIL
jgi:alpha-tubulin suppressor-like RCC1 family protein